MFYFMSHIRVDLAPNQIAGGGHGVICNDTCLFWGGLTLGGTSHKKIVKLDAYGGKVLGGVMMKKLFKTRTILNRRETMSTLSA